MYVGTKHQSAKIHVIIISKMSENKSSIYQSLSVYDGTIIPVCVYTEIRIHV